MTPELKKQIDNNNIYVCEAHFKAECIQSGTILVCITSVIRAYVYTPRRTIVRKKVYVKHAEDMPSTSFDVVEPALCLSTSLTDLISHLDTTVLFQWLTEIAQDENVKCCLSDNVHAVPTYTVIVHSSLKFTAYVYNWPIPDDHKIYNDRKRSIGNVEDIQELLSTIETSIRFVKVWLKTVNPGLLPLIQMQMSQHLVLKLYFGILSPNYQPQSNLRQQFSVGIKTAQLSWRLLTNFAILAPKQANSLRRQPKREEPKHPQPTVRHPWLLVDQPSYGPLSRQQDLSAKCYKSNCRKCRNAFKTREYALRNL